MQSVQYVGLQIINKIQETKSDFLVIEAPLQININNSPYTVVMRTPDNDFELITGLLYAEDIYKKSVPLNFTIEKIENNINTIINVDINSDDLGSGYINKRTLLSVSSCGICGKKELKDIEVSGKSIDSKLKFSPEDIIEMMHKMSNHQYNFKKSGGSHAASIFDTSKTLISLKEDIGRHNAVDKVIGDLLKKTKLHEAHFLCVSGRVSYEIITKAFIAKIPVIIAVSACSSLAVDFAKEFGICLVGFTRNDKMTIYSNPEYLMNMEYA